MSNDHEWEVGTTDEEIEQALEALRHLPEEPVLTAGSYHKDLDLFLLTLSDGRRLAIPREDIQAVAHATPEQAADFVIREPFVDIWWPALDDGLHLDAILEGRYGSDKWMDHVRRRTPASAA